MSERAFVRKNVIQLASHALTAMIKGALNVQMGICKIQLPLFFRTIKNVYKNVHQGLI